MFSYLTGVNIPDFSLLVELPTGRAHLVAPKLPVSVTMWSGEPDSNDALKKTYGVDDVLYDSELEGLLDGGAF